MSVYNCSNVLKHSINSILNQDFSNFEFLIMNDGSTDESHEILNNLHAYIDDKPLVVFFPGAYDMQSLKLFNCLADNNYYRAFRLVP